MKHIFMGKINYMSYQFVCYYQVFGYYGNLSNVVETLDQFNDCIEDFWNGCVEPKISKVEYEIIKETTDIQERVSIYNKVKVDNEELYVEKVVQCDNGDIICYTSKVLKEIKDEESKRKTEELKDECDKVHKEYTKNKEKLKTVFNKTNNKKCWQFWRKNYV